MLTVFTVLQILTKTELKYKILVYLLYYRITKRHEIHTMIDEFISITGAASIEAMHYLEMTDYNLEQSIDIYLSQSSNNNDNNNHISSSIVNNNQQKHNRNDNYDDNDFIIRKPDEVKRQKLVEAYVGIMRSCLII